MGSPIDLLLAQAVPLSTAPPAPGLPDDLLTLLNLANGFLAYGRALHVFVSGDESIQSVERWNDPAGWRHWYPELGPEVIAFAEDTFGNPFLLGPDGVTWLDPETGKVTSIAPDIEGWAEQLHTDGANLTGWRSAHEWQQEHGPLRDGNRLRAKTPFVLGGGYDFDNLFAGDVVEAMDFRGYLFSQIRDLPDGTKIRFIVTDDDSN